MIKTHVDTYKDELLEGEVTCHKTFVSVLKEENVLDDLIGEKVLEYFKLQL